ncbi:MAG TPA: hypothetical protein DEP50_07910 [Acinetobacter lwoffii]|nr:hypothetical protein [Acinetobacter lwoffii]
MLSKTFRKLIITAVGVLVLGGCVQNSIGKNIVTIEDLAATNVAADESSTNSNSSDITKDSTETAAEIESANTYWNQDYGIVFDHPEGWIVNMLDEGDEAGMSLSYGDIIILPKMGVVQLFSQS